MGDDIRHTDMVIAQLFITMAIYIGYNLKYLTIKVIRHNDCSTTHEKEHYECFKC